MEYMNENLKDWECEDEHIPFVKFDGPSGSKVFVIDEYLGSRQNKFRKIVHDFRVKECLVPLKGPWAERILSVSSRKILAGLTRIKNSGVNEGKFWGEVPVCITWEGESIKRWYDVGIVDNFDTEDLRRTLGFHS